MLTYLLLRDGLGRVTNQGIDHMGGLGVVVIEMPRVDIQVLAVAVGDVVLGGEHSCGGVRTSS